MTLNLDDSKTNIKKEKLPSVNQNYQNLEENMQSLKL